MVILKTTNLIVRFFLEVCLLVALAYWGFQLDEGLLVRGSVGIGAPLLVAIVWGIYLAPASRRRLHGVSFLVLELIIFGLTAAALYAAKQPVLALALLLVYAINKILIVIWKQ